METTGRTFSPSSEFPSKTMLSLSCREGVRKSLLLLADGRRPQNKKKERDGDRGKSLRANSTQLNVGCWCWKALLWQQHVEGVFRSGKRRSRVS